MGPGQGPTGGRTSPSPAGPGFPRQKAGAQPPNSSPVITCRRASPRALNARAPRGAGRGQGQAAPPPPPRTPQAPAPSAGCACRLPDRSTSIDGRRGADPHRTGRLPRSGPGTSAGRPIGAGRPTPRRETAGALVPCTGRRDRSIGAGTKERAGFTSRDHTARYDTRGTGTGRVQMPRPPWSQPLLFNSPGARGCWVGSTRFFVSWDAEAQRLRHPCGARRFHTGGWAPRAGRAGGLAARSSGPRALGW